jgi:hypothetical protein
MIPPDYVFTREDHIHYAKVCLTECSRRRRLVSWINFYWTVFGWAQNARRRAAQCKQESVQGELFGTEL